MALEHGVQTRLVKETTTGAGVTTRTASVETDSVLVTLFVSSVTSGSLTVVVVGQAGDDPSPETDPIINFPVITAPTTNVLLRSAALTTQRFLLRATYTGICSYEIHIRAINGGAVAAKIVGADSLTMSQATVTSTPAVLIASALNDRAGMVIKNWDTTNTIFIGSSAAEATPAVGYPLAARDGLALDIAAGVEVWAATASGTADIRLAESGG